MIKKPNIELNFIPLTELLKKWGIYDDERNLQSIIGYYGHVRNMDIIVGKYEPKAKEWFYDETIFDAFMVFCINQSQTNYKGQLMYISHIAEIHDTNCPFNLYQLGNLFMLDALNGDVVRSGGNRLRKRVYTASYDAFKEYYIKTITENNDIIIEVNSLKPDYHNRK